MTIARNHHLFIEQPTYFHLISRCVRRAFLCGKDKFTGKRFDHRKRWLEKRIFAFSELFYIDLFGYAIMSNHYHLVIKTRPDLMRRDSDEEIAKRWCQLFPNKHIPEELRIRSISQDAKKISLYRNRLSNISWLMRCLNERLARLANMEDGCGGRFWQGRFRSQLLLDEPAVYTCMAYVDLNPVRAGIEKSPESSSYTSIFFRINHHSLKGKLKPLNNSNSELELKLSDYIQLVDEAGRSIRDDKTGFIPERLNPILDRLKIKPPGFVSLMRNLTDQFSHGIGSAENLVQISEKLNLNWVKGKSLASRIFE